MAPPGKSLSASDVSKLISIIKSFKINVDFPAEVQDAAHSIQYVGFDPATIAATFWKRGEDTERSPEQIQIDFLMACVIACERGNIREDTIKRTGQVGLAWIRNLIKDYDIKIRQSSTSPKIVLERDTLTFTRIAQSVPIMTCKIMLEGHAKTTSLKRDRFGVRELPASMQTSAFSSFVKLADGMTAIQSSKIIRLAGIAWALEFNQTINKVESKLSDEDVKTTVLPKVERFFDLGNSYDIIDLSRSKEILFTYGITDGNSLHPNVVAVAYKFNQMYNLDNTVNFNVKVSDGYIDYCNKVLTEESVEKGLSILDVQTTKDFVPI
jgi:hypothetical protein